MLFCACLKIDTRAPRLVQSVNSGTYHPRQSFKGIKLAKCRFRQACLDYSSEGLVIDRPGQTASQAHCQLLEGQNLKPVPALARCSESEFPHRQPTVGDDRTPKPLRHDSLPAQSGRCVQRRLTVSDGESGPLNRVGYYDPKIGGLCELCPYGFPSHRQIKTKNFNS